MKCVRCRKNEADPGVRVCEPCFIADRIRLKMFAHPAAVWFNRDHLMQIDWSRPMSQIQDEFRKLVGALPGGRR